MADVDSRIEPMVIHSPPPGEGTGGFPVDRHATRLSLRETDAFGVLFWGAVTGWAQAGFENLLREAGHPLEDMLALEWHLPVANATIDYLVPVRLGMALTVTTSIVEVGNRSFRLESSVCVESGQLAVRIVRTHVAARHDGGPAGLPDWLRAMGPARPVQGRPA